MLARIAQAEKLEVHRLRLERRRRLRLLRELRLQLANRLLLRLERNTLIINRRRRVRANIRELGRHSRALALEIRLARRRLFQAVRHRTELNAHRVDCHLLDVALLARRFRCSAQRLDAALLLRVLFLQAAVPMRQLLQLRLVPRAFPQRMLQLVHHVRELRVLLLVLPHQRCLFGDPHRIRAPLRALSNRKCAGHSDESSRIALPL